MSSPIYLPHLRGRALENPLRGLNPASRTNSTQRWSSQKTFKDEILSFYARQSEGIPYIPDYLANTVYARLVHKQHTLFNKKNDYKYKARAEPVEPTQVTRKNMSHSLRQQLIDERIELSFYEHISTSSNNNGGKKVPTVQEYAALSALLNRDSYDFTLVIQDLRLPSAWDVRPKCDFIEVNSDHLELTYTGDGKDGTDIASVRANHAMRKQCGIYYFEIQVISKGIDGHIGIGFCRNINSLNRFPGWEEHSWGYHAENGKIYSGPGTEKPYGPAYGTGDVIGCGVDFRDMSAFYTMNGIYLGIAFEDIYDTDIYPFVGFKTAGEKIEANFGKKPFLYDIKQHRASEKRNLLKDITKQSIGPAVPQFPVISSFVETDHVDKVVMEYLRHHGFFKSAAALEDEIKLKSDEPLDVDNEMAKRQEIRDCIMEGEIDKAIMLCNMYYPSVLEKNPLVELKLQCRKFLEMVRRVQTNVDQSSTDEYEARSLQVSEHRNNSIKRTTSEADLEPYICKKKKQKTTEQVFPSLEDVMEFGNSLKQKYGPKLEHNASMKAELMVTFSTLAYSDLKNEAVAYLFEKPYIEKISSELNIEILVSLGQHPESSIERIYKQTAVTIEELVMGGNAKAALLEPERDCLKILDL